MATWNFHMHFRGLLIFYPQTDQGDFHVALVASPQGDMGTGMSHLPRIVFSGESLCDPKEGLQCYPLNQFVVTVEADSASPATIERVRGKRVSDSVYPGNTDEAEDFTWIADLNKMLELPPGKTVMLRQGWLDPDPSSVGLISRVDLDKGRVSTFSFVPQEKLKNPTIWQFAEQNAIGSIVTSTTSKYTQACGARVQVALEVPVGKTVTVRLTHFTDPGNNTSFEFCGDADTSVTVVVQNQSSHGELQQDPVSGVYFDQHFHMLYQALEGPVRTVVPYTNTPTGNYRDKDGNIRDRNGNVLDEEMVRALRDEDPCTTEQRSAHNCVPPGGG
jgi:hypothetical protein